MKTRLILVACATEVQPSLAANLAATGCVVKCVASGLELLRKARRRLPDLIILDATLPDMDVGTVCDILGSLPSTSGVPRLRLAERGDGLGNVAAVGERPGLAFNSQELLARVNEMLEPVEEMVNSEF